MKILIEMNDKTLLKLARSHMREQGFPDKMPISVQKNYRVSPDGKESITSIVIKTGEDMNE